MDNTLCNYLTICHLFSGKLNQLPLNKASLFPVPLYQLWIYFYLWKFYQYFKPKSNIIYSRKSHITWFLVLHVSILHKLYKIHIINMPPKTYFLKFNLSSSCWLIKINISGIQYFQSEKLIISFSHLTAFKRFSTKKKIQILKTEWKALNNFLAASLSFPQHVLWFLAIPIYLLRIHYALLYLCFHTFKSLGFGATSIIWIYWYENFIFLPIISPN